MLLTIHIFGAVVTAVLAIISLIAVHKNSNYLPKLRIGVIAVGIFQIISGTILVVTSAEISIARVCIASIVYLGAVGGVELALRRGILRQQLVK